MALIILLVVHDRRRNPRRCGRRRVTELNAAVKIALSHRAACRRVPPISWWLWSRPSRRYPAASATWMELVFQGSIYSSTRYRAGMVQANRVSVFNALVAMPRPRCNGETA